MTPDDFYTDNMDTKSTQLDKTWRSKEEPETNIHTETLKPLKILDRKKANTIDWEAMLDSANSIMPEMGKTDSNTPAKIPERTSSNYDSLGKKIERNSNSSEARQYHFNAPDNKRISENARISWLSKRSGKGGGSIHSSDKAKSWNHHISPKPLDSSFFDGKNEAILNEHNYRKEEFLRLLNGFLEQVEKL